jgi:RNA polymerase sigma-70 factor (ECF subfamily)
MGRDGDGVLHEATHMSDDWKLRASEAMERYACGDDEAFGELYDQLAPRLHAFLSRRMRDRARAEDLLQQSFLQMHAARRHFVAGSEVMPWAFAIARRLLIDCLRKGGREPTADGDAGVAEDMPCQKASPAAIASKRRLLRRVEQELEQIQPTHRIAFELVKLDGIGLQEAAQMLGITVMAVKLRVHRAVQALQERLGSDVREELAEWA